MELHDLHPSYTDIRKQLFNLPGGDLKRLFLLISISIQLLFSCTFIVNKASFFPDKKDIVTTEHLPENVSLIRFKTSDKKFIEALYYNNNLNNKVILYFHGNAGNMYGRMPECKKLFDFGYNVFLVSYRGYSKSEGRPTEKGVYTDAESALTYLLNTCNYPIENVYIFGRSLGTAVAVNLCQKKNIQKLILVTPMSSGRDLADAMGLGFLKPFTLNPFDSYNKINNITANILFIHGTADEVIPYSQGKKLYNHFDGKKTFVSIPMARHNDLEITDAKLYWDSIKDFLEF